MFYVIMMLIISVGVALFAVQNAMMVDVSFLTLKFTTSLVMVIILALLAGVLITLCWVLKMKAEHYLKDKKTQETMEQLRTKNLKLEEELGMLRYTQKQRADASTTIADLTTSGKIK